MKAHALAGRDKPKDAYDICYCLDNYPGGLEELAGLWKQRHNDRDVVRMIAILREKFSSVEVLALSRLSNSSILSMQRNAR